MNKRVEVLSVDALHWSFGKENPVLHFDNGAYMDSVRVDPFPAYSHDREVTCGALALVEAAFPVAYPPRFYLLPCEDEARTNGATHHGIIYGAEERPKPWRAAVVLSAKRIPIHPAMTRYLVAHEYGHVVQMDINHARGFEDATTDFITEYRKVRGLGPAPYYGGGSWHMQPGEVFANDFRILIAGAEVEFWPHPSIPRPESVPGLREWWENEARLAKERAVAAVTA